jgi:hypothetical protein
MPRAKTKAPSAPKRERPSSTVVDKVTPRRRVLADAILEGATLSEAARIANMHPGNAVTALKNDDVKEYLARARAEIEEVSTLKRCDVLNLFIEAIDMARTLCDPANMINGADKVAKMLGYYAPETRRIELSTEAGELHRRLRAMSDADLLEMVSKRPAKTIEGEARLVDDA